MPTRTHNSLLRGLHDQSSEAWERFHRDYRSWLFDWMKCHFRFQAEDAEDVVQQVMADLYQEFGKQGAGERPAFQHNGRSGAFRAWLRKVTYNRALAFLRSKRLRQPVANGEELLNQLIDPANALSALWNKQHDALQLRQAWITIKKEFAEEAWRPVGEILFKDRRVQEVADEFKISRRTLYYHQKAIKDRMKEFLKGMLDE